MSGGPPPGDAAKAIATARERTAARIAALRRDFDEIVESAASAPPDDEHDPEGATLGFERAQVSALLAAARTRLRELDLAAARLADGGYGVCERCGDGLGRERLRARPEARTCVRCAASR